MKIISIQKTTLLDYPGKVSCVLFLYGCNLRCGFCHNPELVIQKPLHEISPLDVLTFLQGRVGLLDGVCITGGEPLMSLDISFVEKIKAMGFLIKLDTNGTFPSRLKKVIDTGLIDYVAMDVKASPEKYSTLVRRTISISLIEESMRIIHSSGIAYEFRTTVIPDIHTVEEVTRMGSWVKKVIGEVPPRFFIQGFKNSGKCISPEYLRRESFKERDVRILLSSFREVIPCVEMRI